MGILTSPDEKLSRSGSAALIIGWALGEERPVYFLGLRIFRDFRIHELPKAFRHIAGTFVRI
jgi:hypothetical protein